MKASNSDRPVRVLLLDIEGTTTPIDFVYQTLFPYARAHLNDFLAGQWSLPDVRTDVAILREEHKADLEKGLKPPLLCDESEEAQRESLLNYARWLMDQDRKSTGLKSLQGKIWQQGYESGQLVSQVFVDVVPAFKRWKEQKRRICIYSSGSVLAQKLLFAYTEEGDLTAFIDDYFDTNTGAKVDAGSYRRIAASLGELPEAILFISDAGDELDAAQSLGMRTMLCVRPGNAPFSMSPKHPSIRSFNEVVLS